MLKTRYSTDETTIELGIDEAGRGPLWGPLMAAAVQWPKETDWTDAHRELAPMIKDSKKISPKKREQIAEKIKTLAVAYGVGIVTAEEIDNWGATLANQTAFRRAVDALQEEPPKEGAPYMLLIDGIVRLPILKEHETQKTIIDGDATYLSIAAASIVAKVEHDRWVTNWCKDNVADAAKYDLLNCKGYGTSKHRDGLKKYGYTDLHRRLYLRKLFPDIIVKRYQLQTDT